jgi:hypothetical protein
MINLKLLVKEKIKRGLSIEDAIEEVRQEIVYFLNSTREIGKISRMMQKVLEDLEEEKEN